MTDAETDNRLDFADLRALTEAMGPVAVFATVDADGTPHAVPVVASWVESNLVFGSHAMSHKVRNAQNRPRASLHFATPGEAFGDALLLKGAARVVVETTEAHALWDTGLFPFLPMMYSGPDDAMLRFVEFRPSSAFVVRNGGRGPVERWRDSDTDLVTAGTGATP